MKFNGTIFSKPQQDQLKENIGNELEKVSAKVDEVDARMLNYTGDWTTGNEYHENDLVTWADDGQLYEVIKAHTSSGTLKPGNAEYYKAMTMGGGVKYTTVVKQNQLEDFFSAIDRKSVVDIEFTAGYNTVHATLMTRSTSFIAFGESVRSDAGAGDIAFNIVIAHIVSNTSIIAKQYNFDANGNITTSVVNVSPNITVTFIK